MCTFTVKFRSDSDFTPSQMPSQTDSVGEFADTHLQSSSLAFEFVVSVQPVAQMMRDSIELISLGLSSIFRRFKRRGPAGTGELRKRRE